MRRYQTEIRYLIAGLLTAGVNYGVFWLLIRLAGPDAALWANAVAFILGTLFAYWSNKVFVFRCLDFRTAALFRELAAFFAARLFSFGLEEAGLSLCIRCLHVEQVSLFGVSGLMAAKIGLSLLAALLNYFVSKYMIFRGKP